MADKREAVVALEQDLRAIFGPRLQAIVIYGLHAAAAHEERTPTGGHLHAPTLTHALVTVESLTAADLKACAERTTRWHGMALATPLVLAAHEFERSLDAFPYEFGEILADHVLWTGTNPLEGLRVNPLDLRRACEVQARSHLLHLREGYLETAGNPNGVAVLIVRSAGPFGALIRSMARLVGSGTHDTRLAGRAVQQSLGLADGAISDVLGLIGLKEMPSADATSLFPRYLHALERLTAFVDGWTEK
jgi:hypothetical protein